MREAGLGGVNPGHPDLLALLDAGATDAEFAGAASTALAKGKGFAYALGTLKRQRAEAAQMAQGLHRGPMPRASTRRDRQLATAGALTTASAPPNPTHFDHDLEAEHVRSIAP